MHVNVVSYISAPACMPLKLSSYYHYEPILLYSYKIATAIGHLAICLGCYLCSYQVANSS